MELRDDRIVLDKPLNELDRLILDVTDILDANDIEYAVVSGYVAVLLGRSRATEDIDVIVEPFDRATAERLADQLRAEDLWGPNMPLDELYDVLADDLPIRIARDGDRIPTVECKFATDRYDRLSVEETILADFGDRTLTIGSLELQIAYKLRLGAQKDLEDARHLLELTEGTLNTRRLESYVDDLDVTDAYDRLH